MHKEWSLLLGRYQVKRPHEGHIALVRALLDEGKNVCIALRKESGDDANLYTQEERCAAFTEIFATEIAIGQVCVINVPDIVEVCYGRTPGWGIREIKLDNKTEQISGTKTRKLQQKAPFVIWMTGIPCAGKTTLSNALYTRLKNTIPVVQLDGDIVRTNPEKYNSPRNIGFTSEERKQHILRMGDWASTQEKEGMSVICSFVSPEDSVRQIVGGMCRNFILIHVHADVMTCAARDVKGMYAKAMNGEIKNFTGVSAPYENPAHPDIFVDTGKMSVEECVDVIMSFLHE